MLRVPTDAGLLYFKATSASLAHEARLLEVLARRRPDAVTEVVASDDRGWMLTRDAGTSLDGVPGDEALRVWERALPAYAQLQVDVVPDAEELAAAVPLDRRTATLPDGYDTILEDRDVVLDRSDDELTAEQYGLARSLAPHVRAVCAGLAESGIPDTIQNDDFGATSVFPTRTGFRFVDWGDACVSFPFFTLTITLRVIAWLYDLPPDARELVRLRDAYLEPWTSYAPRAELRRLEAGSRLIGQVCRAVMYYDTAKNDSWGEPGSVPWSLRLVIEPEAWRADRPS